MWRVERDAAVLTVEAAPAAGRDPHTFHLLRLGCPGLVLRSSTSGAEHVLLGDGTGQLRLDVVSGTVLHGPVRLSFVLSARDSAEAKLKAVQNLLALLRLGRMPREVTRKRRQTQQWALALRAFDAYMAGASQRQIASALFGAAVVELDWCGTSTYLRSRVQRLIRVGETLVHGGYRELLR